MRAAFAPRRFGFLLAAIAGALAAVGQNADDAGGALLLRIDDAIGPATSDHVVRGLERAADRGRELVILEMDTPGGLDTSMRAIIRAILASPVPVVTYVSPPGARAASAGTYILYASHVAAMAPATNVGAATPVSIGGGGGDSGGADDSGGSPGAGDDGGPARAPDGGGSGAPGGAAPPDAAPRDGGRAPPEPRTAEERKAVNDAVAYIRSLAERRGRNADWAERAVRSAASLSARAALDAGVIDLIAEDLDDLLAKLDGRTVEVGGERVALDTDGLAVERFDPDWRTRFLAVISNPTVAYILMLIGIYGLIFEGYSPGAILPGVVGAISLLLALFAFQILPVNYAGLALIALGVVLMIAEFMVPSFGALGIGGIAAFVFGSVILIDVDEVPGFGVARSLIVAIATAGAAAVLGIIWVALRTRALPVVSGLEQLKHSFATALEDFERDGQVFVHGERWRARTSAPVRKGDTLRIVDVDDLVLEVEPRDRSPTDRRS